jgi:organic radical activating enzyme
MCDYCSNSIHGKALKPWYQSQPASRWVEALERLGQKEITITGGEPFLYPELIGLINGFKGETWLYTNLNKEEIPALMSKIEDKAKIRVRATYHSWCEKSVFLKNLLELRRMEIAVSVHAVLANVEALNLRTDYFRSYGFELGIDYDQRLHWSGKKIIPMVKCSLQTVLVAPDGGLYHCVSRMLRKEKPDGCFFTMAELEEKRPTYCKETTFCTPCDLAASFQEAENKK